MMVATFIIGLAVAWLIQLISGILYISENRLLSHEIAVRRRLFRMNHARRSKFRKQLSVGHAENELIAYFYGNNVRDNHLVDYGRN